MSLLSRAAREADRLWHGERPRPPSTMMVPTPLMTPGATPGTLFADPHAEPTHVAWMRYGPGLFESGDLLADEPVSLLTPQPGQILWIDVRGTGDRDRLQAVGDLLGVHP